MSSRHKGAIRELHVARWMTLMFGALTVWGTYRLRREIFPQQPAIGLLAAALVAFTPQFLFINGATSNDPTASALSALSLWAAVWSMQRGFTLRLVDHTGAEWSLWQGAEFDNWSAKKWPVKKAIRQTAGIVLPHGLPSGEYALLVSVSDRQRNEVIPPADGSTEVKIATMKVEP